MGRKRNRVSVLTEVQEYGGASATNAPEPTTQMHVAEGTNTIRNKKKLKRQQVKAARPKVSPALPAPVLGAAKAAAPVAASTPVEYFQEHAVEIEPANFTVPPPVDTFAKATRLFSAPVVRELQKEVGASR